MPIQVNDLHERVYSIRPLFTALAVFSLLIRLSLYKPPPVFKGFCSSMQGTVVSISRTADVQKLLLSNLFCNGTPLEGSVQVKTRSFPLYSIGDCVQFTSEFKQPPRYMQLKGVSAIVSYPDLNKLEQGLSISDVRKFFSRMQQILVKKCKHILPSPQGYLLSGLLFGSSNIPYDFAKELKESGTTHIVVASGFNFIIVINAVTTLALMFGETGSLLFSISGIIVYALIVGASPPVLRAALMSFFAFLGRFFHRQPDSGFALVFTSVLLLHFNPALLWNVSFQLTFFATLGIIYLAPFFKNYLKFIPREIKSVLTETWSAQLATFPVLFLHFGQKLSVTSFICNILIVSVIPFITGVGFISIFLSFISGFFGKISAFILYPLLSYVVLIIKIFS